MYVCFWCFSSGTKIFIFVDLSRYLLVLSSIANSLDPDQAGHYVWPDLDPNYLKLIVILKRIV